MGDAELHERVGQASRSAAPYSPEQLARLRAAIRAGLRPTAPELSGHAAAEGDDPPAGTPACEPDSLPEHTDYRDEGCRIAPACLRCPLERCIYDRTALVDPLYLRGRDRRMRVLAGRGWDAERLGRLFHLSPAHVRRILRPARSPRRRG